MALNCLVFEKIAFFVFWQQTDEQNQCNALSRSRCGERQLNNLTNNNKFFAVIQCK